MTQHQNRRRCLLGLPVAAALLVLAASTAGAAGLWSSAEMVGPNDRPQSIFANVAISCDGTVWVVWSSADSTQGDSEVYCVAIRDFVQSPRRRIHGNNTVMDRCPLMSMGTDGVPWVVWERYSSAYGYVQVVTHWTGAAWAPADTVFTLGDRWDEYTIHASSSNDVWVVKSSRADGRTDRDLYVRHWNGNAWGETEQMGFTGNDDESPAMTTDGAGRAVLAWLRCDAAPGRHFVSAASHDGIEWGEPANVDTAAGNIAVCDMSITPSGSPIIVWSGNGYYPTTDLEYAILTSDGWTYGGLVNRPDNTSVDWDAGARLSRAPDGDLWVIWPSSVSGEWPTAITVSQWTGDGWGDEELASAPDTLGLMTDTGPDVAAAGAGQLWAVWERMDDASPYDTDVYAAHRAVLTSIGAWGLSAEEQGDAIRLSWWSSPDCARRGFHVWRVGAGDDSPCAEGIPAAAVRLTKTAIQNCTACVYVDGGAHATEAYCYWIEQVDDGQVLGPVAVTMPELTSDRGFRTFPNPSGCGAVFLLPAVDEAGEIRIYTAGGRLVAALPTTGSAPDASTGAPVVRWDGTDASGRRVPSGVYYAELRRTTGGAASERVRVVVLR